MQRFIYNIYKGLYLYIYNLEISLKSFSRDYLTVFPETI